MSGASFGAAAFARPEADGARLVLEGGVKASLEPSAALHEAPPGDQRPARTIFPSIRPPPQKGAFLIP